MLASKAAGRNIQLQFTPHLMPMVRGLLATVYGRLRDPGLTAEDLTTLYQVTYKNHPCIDILPVGTYPSTKWVKHTNKALISVAVDKRTSQVIVMSVIIVLVFIVIISMLSLLLLYLLLLLLSLLLLYLLLLLLLLAF